MRRVFLTILTMSLTGAAMANPKPQVTPTPSSDHQARVEEQAARIMAYRRAMKAEQKVAPNGLEEMTIYVQPDGSPAPTQPEAQTHLVVTGDTLFGVSRKYGVDVQALKSANGIEGSAIQLGQSLIIPVVKEASIRKITRIVEPITPSDEVMSVSVPEKPQSYAVAPRDTLYAIAQRTCTSTADLITLNALTAPSKLKPGQMLALPENHCLER